jgi:hypothetical protein
MIVTVLSSSKLGSNLNAGCSGFSVTGTSSNAGGVETSFLFFGFREMKEDAHDLTLRGFF